MAEYIDEYVHRHMYCNLYIYYDIHTESPDIVIKTYVCRAKFNGQQNIYILASNKLWKCCSTQHSTLYLCAYADNSVNYAPVNMPNVFSFSLKYAGPHPGLASFWFWFWDSGNQCVSPTESPDKLIEVCI